MTLYLDTSSLVKLYVEESGSLDVVAHLEAADVVATASVAYAEARAALARRHRERALSSRAHQEARRRLDADWPALLTIVVTDDVSRHAGDLAERYGLRGYDAIHLAAYAVVARAAGVQGTTFSSADRTLNRAAAALARTL